MNAIGIDVSKGKSTIAIMRPFGEIVLSPFEIYHTEEDFKYLISEIKKLHGESKVIMEFTGKYYQPIANFLYQQGVLVSVVNAILVHDYSNNSIRKVKTDRKDAIKIANYGLDRWLSLPVYVPEDELRQSLKIFNRQFSQFSKLKVMLSNNLISLIDQTFPGIDSMFGKTPRKDGHQKWIDFIKTFWHKDCVITSSLKVFTNRYKKWCQKAGYHYQSAKPSEIYYLASNVISTLPHSSTTQTIIKGATNELLSIVDTLENLRQEMNRLASQLPEYPIVMSLHGVGMTLGPQLIAEIGDVRRFHSKKALVAYAGHRL